MSWKSLSDIYAERVIRENTEASIENIPAEPWRPLAEMYTEGVVRKSLNEATVNIKFHDTDEDHTFELEDVYARKVLGFTAFTEQLVEDLIIQWAETGKWSNIAIKRIVEQVNTALMTAFKPQMTDPATIRSIASDIKKIITYKSNNQKFYEFVQSKSNDIYNLFKIPDLEILNDSKFISALCQIDFAENKVSVGPGEVAITLFTEATNPHKGDLHVNGMEIELKGYDGRIGKGEREANIYRNIISKNTNVKAIEDKQNALFNEIINIKAQFPENLILNFKFINTTSKLYKVLNLIYNSNNIKDFLNKSGIISGYFTKGESVKIQESAKGLVSGGGDNLESFKNAVIEIIKIVNNIYGLKLGKETSQFRTFFSSNIVDDDKKIETLFEYVEPKYLNDEIKNIIVDFYNKGVAPENIVGAISIANYQLKEDFKYIIFANTQPRIILSGSLPCKVVGPFEDYDYNLKFILENINDIVFSPNADRGGFQTQFRGLPATKIENEPSLQPPLPQAEGERLNIPT